MFRIKMKEVYRMSAKVILALSCFLAGVLSLAVVELFLYDLKNFSRKKLQSLFVGGCLLIVADFLVLLVDFIISQLKNANWSVGHFSLEMTLGWLLILAIGCIAIAASTTKSFNSNSPS